MSSRKKNTYVYIAFSYLDTLIAFVNGILIVPFYLTYIDMATYGAWLATGNILAWLIMIDPGTSDVTIQRISKSIGKNNRTTLSYQVSSSIIISLVASSICLLVGLMLTDFVTSIINIKESSVRDEIAVAFRIAMIGVSIALFNYSIHAVLIGLQKQFYTGASRISGRLIGILVSVIMVLNGFGIRSIATGILVANALELTINLINFGKLGVPFAISKRYFKAYIRIFSITFFSRIFGSVYNNLDLILVARFFNPEVVAQLELTRRPMKFIRGFLLAPSKSLMPTLANYLGEHNAAKGRELVQKLIVGFFCVFVIAGLGFLMFNQHLISIWVGDEFFIGERENMLLSLGLVVLMWNYILSNINVSFGNIKGTSYSTVVTSIIGILLLLVLGEVLGIVGIIIAPIISVLISQLWYYLLYIHNKIRFKRNFWEELIKVFLAGISIYYLLNMFYTELNENYVFSYWLLALQVLVLIISLLTLFLLLVKDFRVLMFKDLFKKILSK